MSAIDEARQAAQAWTATKERAQIALDFGVRLAGKDLAAILARLDAYESALAPHLLDGPVSDFLAGRLAALSMAWTNDGTRVEYGFTPADPLASVAA